MSLRTRLSVVVALFAALTAITVGVLAYDATASRLMRGVDTSLSSAVIGTQGPQQQVQNPLGSQTEPPATRRDGGPQSPFRPGGLFQLATAQRISKSGTVTTLTGTGILPVTARDRQIAEGSGSAWLRTSTVDGLDYRILTSPLPQGGAIEVGRNISDIIGTLKTLQVEFIAVGLLAVVVAALAGIFVARAITRPLFRLGVAAQRVASTGDLDPTIDLERTDEIGRLAHAFRRMLDALKQSQAQQQRLVQDASHELRTPLTSMSANVELLQRYDLLPPETRSRILGDLQGEMGELNALVTELVELATVGPMDEPITKVDLMEATEGIVERFRARSGRHIEMIVVDTPPPLYVNSRQLERAVSNLVDNALKFSRNDSSVHISITSSYLAVSNAADVIAEEDLPHLFDRFYRAPTARQIRGSGLGLAIVAEFVRNLGGTTFARNEASEIGNHVVVGFTLPTNVDR